MAAPERKRPALVWRLAAYLALLLVLSIVFQGLALYAAMFLPPLPPSAVGVAALLVAALFAGGIVLKYMDHRPPGALGFAPTRAAVGETVRGTLLGGALIGVAVLLLLLTGSAAFAPDDGTAAGYVRVLVSTGLYFAVAAAWEEAVFRGYAFQALVERAGAWPATLGSAAVFALVHGDNPNVTWLGIGNIFLAGTLLAVAYLRTQSLWFPTAIHLGWNWVMATLLGFPVSGWDAFDVPVYDARETGADWWTGGLFGPEAGLAATLALLAGTVWLLRTPRLHPAAAMRKLRPLVEEQRFGVALR